MRPLRNYVLLRVDPSEKKTGSGLYIHEQWKSLPPTATVLAVGPDVTEVKVGDRVLIARYAVIEIEGTTNDKRLILDKHIMAVLDGEES